MTIEDLLGRLEGVRRSGDGWSAKCPAHEDRTASLSIGEGDKGIVLHCHAGCTAEAIVGVLSLTMADLFPDRGEGPVSPSRPRLVQSNGQAVRLTLAQYADAKRLPIEFLKGLGVGDVSYLGTAAVRIPYLDIEGRDIAIQFRCALTGKDRFRWRTGDKPCPYGLSRLAAARELGEIVIVEGASDVQTLFFHEIPALGIPGAASWRADWDTYLDGIKRIVVVREPDQGGAAVETWLGRVAWRDRVRLLRLDGAKDPSDFYLQDPATFRDRWRAAVATATSWTKVAGDRRQDAAREHFEAAKDLLHAPDLIDRIGAAMHASGYAGDLTAPMLAYVAIVSCMTRRPMNVACVAPSGAGKNRGVDAAVALTPPEAVYIVGAGSARALVYTDEVFEHRTVIFSEADSIPEEGPAASAVRSIVTDAKMSYQVVEKNAATGRFQTRTIEKRGPTGLITTSTKSLGEQMSTRVLEVPICDDAAQTKKVMQAHAAAVRSGASPVVVTTAPFIALQRYLRAIGPHDVTVPFAGQLADLVPAGAVRMRRDFRQLLTCIQAIAVLHVCQRERTADGWVVATIDDYRVARDLVGPIFDAALQDTVTPVIRLTVEAVHPGEELMLGQLADRLRIAKSTASWRVERAITGGWLVNLETGRGRAARLRRGAPLPDETTVLPAPEIVREVFECSGVRRHGDTAPPPLVDPVDAGAHVNAEDDTFVF